MSVAEKVLLEISAAKKLRVFPREDFFKKSMLRCHQGSQFVEKSLYNKTK